MKPSDYIAFAAFVISLGALYQTHEANSPMIVVTPVAERSYVTCVQPRGEWETRTIMRFNVSNIGGRATTLERLTQSSESLPIVVQTEDGKKAATNYSIVRLERLTDIPDVTTALTSDLNRVFDAGKSVTLVEDKRARTTPPLLNISIEAGKSVTLEFGVSTDYYDENRKRVEAIALALQASFSHNDVRLLRAVTETQRIGRGRCLPDRP